MDKTLDAIKQLFWPNRCASCDELLNEKEKDVCEECALEARVCGDFSAMPRVDMASAYFMYEGTVRELITRWKYHADFGAAKAIFRLMDLNASKILPDEVPENTVVVSVPPHPDRLAERGYDPAREIARRVCENLNTVLSASDGESVSYQEDAVVRTRHTVKQAGLDAEERHENLRDAFNADVSLKGKHIILVDDVCTTGATAVACAKSLMDAEVEFIYLICLAKTEDT